MSEKETYVLLSKAFNYWELCYLEDALRSFKPSYKMSGHDEEDVKALLQKITAARGWQHHLNKTDRSDL